MTVRRWAFALLLSLVVVACGVPGGGSAQQISAVFGRASNLFVGSEVRVLGIQVGTVTEIVPEGDTVRVAMTVRDDQRLPADVGAALVPTSLLGERVIQLEPPYTGGPTFEGDVIPIERTAVPAEVDEVLRSFQSFASALDEKVLAELIDAAAETLEGQGSGLNRLIEQGADTVEILDESSGDLNALVNELGSLNATLATRDEKLGRTLERLSTVMQILAGEKENIIGSIDELRRFTQELRPLVDEHTGPLVRDLEVLTTTLSTVDRNLERVADTYAGSERLTSGFAPQSIDYDTGRWDVHNATEQIVAAIELRLMQRLEGVCLRLELDECASSEFWEPLIPAITCVDAPNCTEAQTSMGDALAQALRELPPEARERLVRDVRRRARQEEQKQAPEQEPSRPRSPSGDETEEPETSPIPSPTLPPLPLPDPRLDSLQSGALEEEG